MRELPLACSLSGRDFEERAERWRAVAARGLTGGRREGGAVRLDFASREGVERELRELVALEEECCAFLDLVLTPSADGRVTLSVSGPPGAAPVVESFLALAGRPAPLA